MIKRISLMTKQPQASREEFARHWIDVHAPLAAALPGLRRYVQHHIVREQPRNDRPTLETQVDGIAEMWFDDEAAMARANASPEQAALSADSALFTGRIKSLIVESREFVPDAG